MCIFFFNDTATTEIYTLSLHDALPILRRRGTGLVAALVVSIGLSLALRYLVQVVFGGRSQSFADYQNQDRKSTRLNSSHANISYAVFCLKKKKTQNTPVSNIHSAYTRS